MEKNIINSLHVRMYRKKKGPLKPTLSLNSNNIPRKAVDIINNIIPVCKYLTARDFRFCRIIISPISRSHNLFCRIRSQKYSYLLLLLGIHSCVWVSWAQHSKRMGKMGHLSSWLFKNQTRAFREYFKLIFITCKI